MSETDTNVSRRRFCAGACQVASGATLATLFSGCGGITDVAERRGLDARRPVRPASPAPECRSPVAGSALADVGGAALVESTAGVFLLSRTSATTFTAIDAICTHEACTITGADGATYVCPCHGSRYNRSGQVHGRPGQGITSAVRHHASRTAS